ncbi:hypothetical protein WKH92_07765, partial [Xanthomonas oryzae pv. oryzae]
NTLAVIPIPASVVNQPKSYPLKFSESQKPLQVPVCGLFAIRMGQGGSNYFPVLFKTHFQ